MRDMAKACMTALFADGTGGGTLLWPVQREQRGAPYVDRLAGNKLFQGTFIKIINPQSTLLQVLLWTALNSGVALVGYYFAAFTIDK